MLPAMPWLAGATPWGPQRPYWTNTTQSQILPFTECAGTNIKMSNVPIQLSKDDNTSSLGLSNCGHAIMQDHLYCLTLREVHCCRENASRTLEVQHGTHVP